MKNLLFYSLCLSVLIMFTSSCASLTGFEEGRTVGEGNSELIFSGNLTSVPDLLDDDPSNTLEDLSFPNIEVSYKYGVSEKFDVGLRANTTFAVSGFGKYQLVGDKSSSFALSGGLEIGTFAGITYTFGVPIYTSFYLTDAITLNVNPRFLYQLPIAANSLDGITYLGGNVGLLFGRKNKFGIDFGFYGLGGLAGDGRNLTTIGVGGKFKFGDNDSSSSSKGRSRRR